MWVYRMVKVECLSCILNMISFTTQFLLQNSIRTSLWRCQASRKTYALWLCLADIQATQLIRHSRFLSDLAIGRLWLNIFLLFSRHVTSIQIIKPIRIHIDLMVNLNFIYLILPLSETHFGFLNF